MQSGKSNKIKDFLTGHFQSATAGLRNLFGGHNDNDPDPEHPAEIELANLHPTQMAVGMKQVEFKQKGLRKLAGKKKELEKFILERPIRVVLGPGGQAYVIDHHHLALALVREGHTKAPVSVAADYSKMSEEDFWNKMYDMKYVYPYDADGKKRPFDEIPEKLTELQDDPYRALAGYARNEGAFNKIKIPFSEFKWANYFRERIPKDLVEKDFDAALEKAVELARHPDAKNLPGFIPPKDKGRKHKRDR